MSIVLKDGSEVGDIRLGRLIEFDERSRDYPIRALVEQRAVANNFDVQVRPRLWPLQLRLDQGPDGACVGFTFAHELAAHPVRVQGVTAKYAREQIYWKAQKIDPWPGGAYPEADPFYEGTSLLAGAKILKQLGYIEEYRWAFSVEDIALALGYEGPVALGCWWYSGMFGTDNEFYVHPTGSKVGGHAILIRAYNHRLRRFTLRNSWGPSWGRRGECYVTWDTMEKLLYEEGEACTPVIRRNIDIKGDS